MEAVTELVMVLVALAIIGSAQPLTSARVVAEQQIEAVTVLHTQVLVAVGLEMVVNKTQRETKTHTLPQVLVVVVERSQDQVELQAAKAVVVL